MTIFTGLILLVAMCGMTGSCLAVQEDLCKSFTDEGAISNGSNNASVKLVIQHSFLDVEKGVVPGLQFNGKFHININKKILQIRSVYL